MAKARKSHTAVPCDIEVVVERAVGEGQRSAGLVLVKKAQVEDADEEEGRTGEGVDEELERGLGALQLRPSPR